MSDLNNHSDSSRADTPPDPTIEPIMPRPMNAQPPGNAPKQHTSLFWPIVLIGFGVLLLLSNLGLFPQTSWSILWRFWPVALIALGIDVMIGHRSVVGAIVSGVLILVLIGSVIALSIFANRIPGMVDLLKPVQVQTASLEHPLGDIDHAFVVIDWTSLPGYVSVLSDSDNIIEADIEYWGNLNFNVNETAAKAIVSLKSYQSGIVWGSPMFSPGARWDVKLHPDVAYDLELDSGSGAMDYDLTALNLTRLNIDSGSGSINVRLPNTGNYDFDLDSGSGAVIIDLPDNVGARVDLDSGSGRFNPDSRFILIRGDADDDGTWETEGFESASQTITISIDQGSGAISIQ